MELRFQNLQHCYGHYRQKRKVFFTDCLQNMISFEHDNLLNIKIILLSQIYVHEICCAKGRPDDGILV